MMRKILAVSLSVGMFVANISAQDMGYVMDKKLKNSIDTFVSEQTKKQDPLEDITIEIETFKLPEYQYEPAVSESTYRHNPIKYAVENSDNLSMSNDIYIRSHLDEIDKDYDKSHEWLTKAIEKTSNNRELEYALVVKHLRGEFKYVNQNRIAKILATNKFSAIEVDYILSILSYKFDQNNFGYPDPEKTTQHVFYMSSLLSNPVAEGIDSVIDVMFDILEFGTLTSRLEAVQALMLAEFREDKDVGLNSERQRRVATKVKSLISEYDNLRYEKDQSILQELGFSNIDYTTNQRQAYFFLVWSLDKVLTKVDWFIFGHIWEKKPGENQVAGAGLFGEDDAMQYSENGLKHYTLKYLVMTFVKNASHSETKSLIKEYMSITQGLKKTKKHLLLDNEMKNLWSRKEHVSSSEYHHTFDHYVLTAWYALEALNVFSTEALAVHQALMKKQLKENLKKVLGEWNYSDISRICWSKLGIGFLVEDIIAEGFLFPVVGIIRINKGFRAVGKFTFKIGKWINPKFMKIWHTNKIFRRAARQNKWASNKAVKVLASSKEIVAKVLNEAHIYTYGKPFVDNFNMYQEAALKVRKVGNAKKGLIGRVRALNSYWKHIAKIKTVRVGQYRVPYQSKETFDLFLETTKELGLKFNVAEQNMIDIIAREHAEMATKKLGTYAIATRSVWVSALLVSPPVLLEVFDTKPYEAIESIGRGLDGIRNNEETKPFIENYKKEERENKEINEIDTILENYLDK